jgi:hypothetical protein
MFKFMSKFLVMRECAWCKKKMGIKSLNGNGITHGICDCCMQGFVNQTKMNVEVVK